MTTTPDKSAPGTTDRGGKDSGDASRKKKKVILWSAILGGVLAVVALLTLLGAWLTFSPCRDYSAPELDEPHFLLLRRIATDLRKNRNLNEAELRLSPDEVDMLLDIVRHSSQFVKGKKPLPPPKSLMFRYRKNGSFFFSAPIPVAEEWCFGGNIYVSGELLFVKNGDEVVSDMTDLRFGRVDLPVPGGLDTVRPSWKQDVKKSLPPEFMNSVRSINAERDGTLVVVYRPRELRKPLKKQLTKLQKNCSGELKVTLEQLIKAL